MQTTGCDRWEHPYTDKWRISKEIFILKYQVHLQTINNMEQFFFFFSILQAFNRHTAHLHIWKQNVNKIVSRFMSVTLFLWMSTYWYCQVKNIHERINVDWWREIHIKTSTRFENRNKTWESKLFALNILSRDCLKRISKSTAETAYMRLQSL